MRICEAVKKRGLKCKNVVVDDSVNTYYCAKHLHLQEELEAKWDHRSEQLKKYRKKYTDSDKKRRAEQVQKARKKYKESGKAQEYEKSYEGKQRKRRYEQEILKKNYSFYNSDLYSVGDFVRISGISEGAENSRCNGFKGIIMEQYEIEFGWYFVDIGEDNDVPIQRNHLRKCEVPSKYKIHVWKQETQNYIKRENERVKIQTENQWRKRRRDASKQSKQFELARKKLKSGQE